MSVFGYLRVSTLVQAERGVGLDSQRKQVQDYADAHGLKIAQWFSDAGVSGAIKDDESEDALSRRHGLMSLLAALHPGDVVIVACTSRLWRSDAARVLVRRELLKKQAQVIAVDNPRFSLTAESATDRFLDDVMSALDALERAQISAKLERGRAARAAAGGRGCGRIPYGYRRDGDAIKIVPDEARQVRRMFTLAQTGATLNHICKMLSAEGYTNRKGEQWARASVQSILTNPYYKGLVRFDGQTYKGVHERTVSAVQWGKVQAQLAKRSKASGASASPGAPQ